MSPRYPVALALALAVSLALSGCIVEEARPVLDFSTGACTKDLDPYTPPPAGSLEVTWENDTTLRVNGFLKTWCGGAEISGNYTLNGDTLTLFYTISTPGPVTSCLCTRGIQYRITGLPRGEYRVVMKSG
jgi:hypothetical protein